MIALHDVSHTNRDHARKTVVLNRATGVFPKGKRVALLGGNGAGKTTLLNLISGAVRPDKGVVERSGSVSWPVGFAGGFSLDMTGAENVRFIARIHEMDAEALVEFVTEFSGMGDKVHAPWRTYSSGQRSRISMGASMGIRFDTYLMDEVTSVGDASFRDKADAYLRDRLRDSGAVIVSHSNETIRSMCDYGAVLHEGVLTFYPDLSEAIEVHNRNMFR